MSTPFQRWHDRNSEVVGGGEDAPSCCDCVYSTDLEPGKLGDMLCRRHPPRADGGATVWPKVTTEDWCAEFDDQYSGNP